MNSVSIKNLFFKPEFLFWFVECVIETDSGVRVGSELVFGSSETTQDELKSIIIQRYL